MFVSSGCPMVFLQSMAVWCVCVRESRVAENTPDCPQTPASVLFCHVGLRGCSVSLFLSDTGPQTCVCVAYPQLRSNPLPAPLWGRPLCLGSHIPPLKNKKQPWLVLALRSVNSSSLAGHLQWISSWSTTAQLSWFGSAPDADLVILAQREPWINRGGVTSVLPQDRHHVLGRALSDTSSRWWWV